MDEWYKDPKILIIGGVAIFGAIILLKPKNSGTAPTASPGITAPNITTGVDLSQTGQNPLGAGYSFMDGSGMQHIMATDPYGNLITYASEPPQAYSSDPMGPQMSWPSYAAGGMSGQYVVNPYGGTSPYYSLFPDVARGSSSTLQGPIQAYAEQ